MTRSKSERRKDDFRLEMSCETVTFSSAVGSFGDGGFVETAVLIVQRERERRRSRQNANMRSGLWVGFDFETLVFLLLVEEGG